MNLNPNMKITPEMIDLARARLATLLSIAHPPKKMLGTVIFAPDGWFCVSTVVTHDRGMETAILDDTIHDKSKMGTFPVEAYKTEEEATKGHKKWVEFIKSGGREITRLGYGTTIKPEKFTLQPSAHNCWTCPDVEIV